MYNSILFSRRGRNVLAWIDNGCVGEDLLILSCNNVLPVDSLVLCNAETNGETVKFNTLSNRIVLLEDGDSTTVNRLYSMGAIDSMLKSLCTM